jgi:YD repeat-containing protein
MSHLTNATDALSRVTNYDYDDFNRLVKITYPPATTGATRLQETIAYDAGGNVTKKTDTVDKNGRRISFRNCGCSSPNSTTSKMHNRGYRIL